MVASHELNLESILGESNFQWSRKLPVAILLKPIHHLHLKKKKRKNDKELLYDLKRIFHVDKKIANKNMKKFSASLLLGKFKSRRQQGIISH